MKSSTASAVIYGLIFAATGVSLPYAGLWFESQGLSGSEIAVILAVPMLARAVTGPMVAIWADGFQLRRTALAWLSVVAALAYGACIHVEGFGLWLVLWFVASTAAASLIPLSDAFTLKLARRERFDFSIPRGVGSVSFIAANVVMGVLLRSESADLILVWAAGVSLLLAAMVLLAPAEPVHEVTDGTTAATAGGSGPADVGPALHDGGAGRQPDPGLPCLLLWLFRHRLARTGHLDARCGSALGLQRRRRSGAAVGLRTLAQSGAGMGP
jgi:MFS family permease